MRKLMIKLLAVSLISVVSIGLFEGLCSAYAWCRYGTCNVERLNEIDAGNSFVFKVNQQSPEFATIVRQHPWLGIVPNCDPTARNWDSAKIENFPVERDPKFFTVLLTGGSLSMLLGASGWPHDLEAAIEAKCDFNGRTLRIFNAAEGSTVQPRQAIALMLYGDAVDAVISLDGFNESARIGDPATCRFEVPAIWFADLNPLVAGSCDQLGASWVSNRIRGFSLRHDSRAAFFATAAMRGGIRRSYATEELPESYRRMFAIKAGDAKPEYGIRQYEKYIRLMHAMSGNLGLKEAHFIQPVPALGKVLTNEEKLVVGKLDYADVYRHLNDDLLKLNDRGIPVVSLVDCFDDIGETVYIDPCHCNDAGYRLMSERIARELAKLWNIPDKQK